MSPHYPQAVTIDETTTKQSIGMWCKVTIEFRPFSPDNTMRSQLERNDYLDSLSVAERKQLAAMNPVESIYRTMRGIKWRR